MRMLMIAAFAALASILQPFGARAADVRVCGGMKNALSLLCTGLAALICLACQKPADSKDRQSVAPSDNSPPGIEASDQTRCGSFRSEFVLMEKQLALASVEGVIDDSAPRETNRLLEQILLMQRATITLDLMREAKCVLPDAAPGGNFDYFLLAGKCVLAKKEAAATNQDTSQLPDCNMGNWTRKSP